MVLTSTVHDGLISGLANDGMFWRHHHFWTHIPTVLIVDGLHYPTMERLNSFIARQLNAIDNLT